MTAVEVNGRSFPVGAGWNELRVGLRGVSRLSVRIVVAQAPGPTVTAGIRELELPDVGAREALRLPVLAERALVGADLARKSLTYLFQRTTGDDPFRRESEHGSASAALVRDRGDAEAGLDRVFSPPAARSWAIDGWASVPNDVSDVELDRLAGVRGYFTSSSRFQGRPGFRASSAFDGTSQPWIAQWPSHGRVWVEWEPGPEATISSLTLDPVPGVRRPTQVRVIGDLQPTPPLAVGPGGTVRLPAPLRAKRFRIEILRAAFSPGASGVERQRRAVGIAEVRGTGVPRLRVRRSGLIDAGCRAFEVAVGRQHVPVRFNATLEDLDAGRPLGFSGCRPVSLPAGETRLTVAPDTLTPYLLRLRSQAAFPISPAPPGERALGRDRDPRRSRGHPARACTDRRAWSSPRATTAAAARAATAATSANPRWAARTAPPGGCRRTAARSTSPSPRTAG